MPYNQNEVVASVTAFYEFLITHLHFEPSELKTPPPEGWPQLTTSRLSALGKSDKVIALLQHLPYLETDEHGPKEIFPYTAPADYTREPFDLQDFEPLEEVADNVEWEKLHERSEDIVVLSTPEA